MTAVKMIFPKYKLAKLLRQPGGKTMAQAVEDAEKGLLTLAVPCRETLDRALTAVDQHLAAFLSAPSKATGNALYREVNDIIGVAATVGLNDFDQAAYSLCDLLDRMQEADRWDRDAIRVHVQSLHLLRQPEALQDQSLKAVLEGLARVREKFMAVADKPAA